MTWDELTPEQQEQAGAQKHVKLLLFGVFGLGTLLIEWSRRLPFQPRWIWSRDGKTLHGRVGNFNIAYWNLP
jgi:hypothetical protein